MVFQFSLDKSGNVAGYGIPSKTTPQKISYANQAGGGLKSAANPDALSQYLKLHGGQYPVFPQKPATSPIVKPTAPIVPLIKPSPPVISNTDLDQEFEDNGKEIDKREPPKPTEEPTTEPVVEKPTEKVEKTSTAAQDALDTFDTEMKKKKEEADAKIATQQAEYQSYFQTSLANINSTTAQTITNIQSLFAKRITQQKRIDQLQIDSAKAHGIGGGAQFFSEAFKDAIMEREKEADVRVSELEGERNNLIAEAKNARDEGEAGLLRQKIGDLKKVETDINAQLHQTYQDSLERYKLQLAAIKEKEEAQKKLFDEETKKTQKRLVGMAIEWADDYEKAKDKGKFIKDLEAKGWGSATDIFLEIKNALKGKRDEDAKETKAKEDSAYRKAQTAKLYADIEKGKKETGDFSKADKQKLEQRGLLNAPRQQQLDFLEMEDFEYEEEYGEGGEQSAENLKSQLRQGEILVKNKKGEVGAIAASEFDPKLYTKL